MKKISAKEMMDLVVGIDQKVSTLVRRDAKQSGNNKAYSKAGTAIAILLMVVGVAILALMFVPQLVELIPVVVINCWQWICLSYAAISVIVISLFNIRIPVRVLSVLLAITPIAATLIVAAL